MMASARVRSSVRMQDGEDGEGGAGCSNRNVPFRLRAQRSSPQKGINDMEPLEAANVHVGEEDNEAQAGPSTRVMRTRRQLGTGDADASVVARTREVPEEAKPDKKKKRKTKAKAKQPVRGNRSRTNSLSSTPGRRSMRQIEQAGRVLRDRSNVRPVYTESEYDKAFDDLSNEESESESEEQNDVEAEEEDTASEESAVRSDEDDEEEDDDDDDDDDFGGRKRKRRGSNGSKSQAKPDIRNRAGQVWCVCRSRKEFGLLVMCDGCECWVHGGCVGIRRKSEVPQEFYCHTCAAVEDDMPVRCVCDSTEHRGGTLMICCDGCNYWLHGDCVNITKAADVPTKYYCGQCRYSHRTRNEVVRCVCDNLEDEGFMVQCSMCEKWQHGSCIGYQNQSQVPDLFKCTFCRSTAGGLSLRQRRSATAVTTTPSGHNGADPDGEGSDEDKENDKEKDNRNKDELTYCICESKKEGFMLKCDICTDWFHDKCMGIFEEDLKEHHRNFICPGCSLHRQPQLLSNTQFKKEEQYIRHAVQMRSYYFPNVACSCRNPDDGSVMVGCEKCGEWFHRRCLGEAFCQRLDEDSNLVFVCNICTEDSVTTMTKAEYKTRFSKARYLESTVDYSSPKIVDNSHNYRVPWKQAVASGQVYDMAHSLIGRETGAKWSKKIPGGLTLAQAPPWSHLRYFDLSYENTDARPWSVSCSDRYPVVAVGLDVCEVLILGLEGDDDSSTRSDFETEVQRSTKARLKTHDSVYYVKWSPDSKELAAGCFHEGAIALFDMTNGGALWSMLEGHMKHITSVNYWPDNHNLLLTSSRDKMIKLWDKRVTHFRSENAFSMWTGVVEQRFFNPRCTKTLEGHSGPVTGARFLDGTSYILSTSSDRTMRLWDVRMNRCVKVINAGQALSGVDVSRSGDQIAVNTEMSQVLLFDLNDFLQGGCHNDEGEDITVAKQILKGHRNGGLSVGRAAFSKDGLRIASGSEDGRVLIWDAEDGNVHSEIHAHGSFVWDTAFFEGKDGRELLVSCSDDGGVSIMGIPRKNERVVSDKSFAVDQEVFAKGSDMNYYHAIVEEVIPRDDECDGHLKLKFPGLVGAFGRQRRGYGLVHADHKDLCSGCKKGHSTKEIGENMAKHFLKEKEKQEKENRNPPTPQRRQPSRSATQQPLSQRRLDPSLDMSTIRRTPRIGTASPRRASQRQPRDDDEYVDPSPRRPRRRRQIESSDDDDDDEFEEEEESSEEFSDGNENASLDNDSDDEEQQTRASTRRSTRIRSKSEEKRAEKKKRREERRARKAAKADRKGKRPVEQIASREPSKKSRMGGSPKVDRKGKRPMRELEEEEAPDIFCICNKQDDRPMVECSKCSKWFHTACLKIRPNRIHEHSRVYCPGCSSTGEALLEEDHICKCQSVYRGEFTLQCVSCSSRWHPDCIKIRWEKITDEVEFYCADCHDKGKHTLEPLLHCVCREPMGKREMIQCETCNQWYHLDCMKIAKERVPDIQEFYCGECTNTGMMKLVETGYCICKRPNRGAAMVQCDGPCKSWMHLRCMKLTPQDVEGKLFYCPKCAGGGDCRVMERIQTRRGTGAP